MTAIARNVFRLLLAAGLLIGCAGPPAPPAQAPVREPASGLTAPLSPAQEHAGGILAYMMKVVLGRAGPPDLRQEWSRRGLSVALDYRDIAGAMIDPGRNRSSLIVLDTRILGLAAVLYHYDPRLNLFKGVDGRTSPFPCSELIALRILLLQKMHRGEKIRLQALIERSDLFLGPDRPVTERDLAETRLSEGEMQLLRETLRSDPHLFRYLTHPSMVRALRDIGAVEPDSFVAGLIAREARPGPVCRFSPRAAADAPLRIAFLPSMTRQFDIIPGAADPAFHFRATDFYRKICETLKKRILETARTEMTKPVDFSRAIDFSIHAPRPLAIDPQNADWKIGRLCPDADLFVVLVGKDVMRSFEIVPGPEGLSGANFLFVDIMDVRRSWIDTEAEAIGRFIASRLSGGGLSAFRGPVRTGPAAPGQGAFPD